MNSQTEAGSSSFLSHHGFQWVFAVRNFGGCLFFFPQKNHPTYSNIGSKIPANWRDSKLNSMVGWYLHSVATVVILKGPFEKRENKQQIREVCTWTPQVTMFLFWKRSVFVKQNPSVFDLDKPYSRCSFALGVSQNHDPGKKIHLSNLSFSPNFKKLQIRWTPPVSFWKLPST